MVRTVSIYCFLFFSYLSFRLITLVVLHACSFFLPVSHLGSCSAQVISLLWISLQYFFNQFKLAAKAHCPSPYSHALIISKSLMVQSLNTEKVLIAFIFTTFYLCAFFFPQTWKNAVGGCQETLSKNSFVCKTLNEAFFYFNKLDIIRENKAYNYRKQSLHIINYEVLPAVELANMTTNFDALRIRLETLIVDQCSSYQCFNSLC